MKNTLFVQPVDCPHRHASFREFTSGKSGDYIRQEYAAGLGFVDMVTGFSGDKFVFELKRERNFKREKVLEQVTTYARKMSVSECYLMVFRKEMAAGGAGI